MRSRVARSIASQPWAIRAEAWETIQAVLARHENGEKLTPEQVRAAIGMDDDDAPDETEDVETPVVAKIGIYGPIVPRGNMLTQVSGMASAEMVAKKIKAAGEAPNVKAIVLDIDSPGGSVQGISELVQAIRWAREAKPVIAVANHWMCSALYWAGAQATEIVGTPSSEVGSIGVFVVHEDLSKAAAREGIKHTFISAGKHKTEGHPFKPLSEDAQLHLQHKVDAIYDRMTTEIAEGMGLKASVVRGESFGQGRSVTAEDALKAGMIHRIATLEETIERVAAEASAGTMKIAARAIAAVDEAPMLATSTPQDAEALFAIQRGYARTELAKSETIPQDSTDPRPGAATEENTMDETKIAELVANALAGAAAKTDEKLAALTSELAATKAQAESAIKAAQDSAAALIEATKTSAKATAQDRLNFLVEEGKITAAEASEAIEDFDFLPRERWDKRMNALAAREPQYLDLTKPFQADREDGTSVVVEPFSLPSASNDNAPQLVGADGYGEATLRAKHSDGSGALDYAKYRAEMYAKQGLPVPPLPQNPNAPQRTN